MELGVGSFAYTWAIGTPANAPERPLTALGLLEKAAALDVHLVQVCDNLPLHRFSPSELDAFETRAAELGVRIEVGTRGIAPEHLRVYLRLATRFRSPILRVVIDTDAYYPGEDEVVRTLSPLMPEFEQAGVCLAIENHDRFKSRTLAHILERIGGEWVGVCLDTVNSLGAVEGPEQVVETLGPWTVNLHVKDYVVYRLPHKMGFRVDGRPAGQGQLDALWLLETLRGIGRDPNAIVELWTPPEATLEETIAKEAAWAEASVVYLRRLIERVSFKLAASATQDS